MGEDPIVFGTRYARMLLGPLSPCGRETERGGAERHPCQADLTPSPWPSPLKGEGKT
jgi:hypothetical protein